MVGAYKRSVVCLLESGWSASLKRIWRWDCKANVKSGKTILTPIETGHIAIIVVNSPDMTMFATGGIRRIRTALSGSLDNKYQVKIWNSKTGKPVATLEGHAEEVFCLVWAPNGKMLRAMVVPTDIFGDFFTVTTRIQLTAWLSQSCI